MSSLHNQSNRSLAYAQHPQPSPFSTQSLNQEHALAPPQLLSQRQLYPQSTNAFETEQHVYRSVTVEAPSNLGFDPLGAYDHHSTGYGSHAKELNLNPKAQTNYGYADYKPTLNFSTAIPTVIAPKQVEVIQPPAAPQWIEPNSHFYCSCPPPSTPSLLYDTVHSALRSLHEGANGSDICTLDCTPTPDRFKLTCTAYQRVTGAATPFVVRIFTTDAANHKYCVEFQRRSGDVIHFYELFRTARTRIQAAHPCPDSKSPGAADPLSMKSFDAALPQLSLKSWSAPPLPQEAGESFQKESILETVHSLLSMCGSPCMDIKLEGSKALAELRCTPAFDLVMKSDAQLHELYTTQANAGMKLLVDQGLMHPRMVRA